MDYYTTLLSDLIEPMGLSTSESEWLFDSRLEAATSPVGIQWAEAFACSSQSSASIEDELQFLSSETPSHFDIPVRQGAISPSSFSLKRAYHSKCEEHGRLKKLKLNHTHLRSASVLQPNAGMHLADNIASPAKLNASLRNYEFTCFASSTAVQGRPTKMAPLESIWKGDTTAWLAALPLQQQFAHLCLDSSTVRVPQRPPIKRHSLPTPIVVEKPLTRARAISAPPYLDNPSSLMNTHPLIDNPALLKAQLLAVLRSRLAIGGNASKEASLRLRKWVLWNCEISRQPPKNIDLPVATAWTRRPPIFIVPILPTNPMPRSPSSQDIVAQVREMLRNPPHDDTDDGFFDAPQTLEDMLAAQAEAEALSDSKQKAKRRSSTNLQMYFARNTPESSSASSCQTTDTNRHSARIATRPIQLTRSATYPNTKVDSRARSKNNISRVDKWSNPRRPPRQSRSKRDPPSNPISRVHTPQSVVCH